MHAQLLLAHSLLPWLVLLALAVRSGASLRAWIREQPWLELHRRLGLAAVIVVDVQLLLGVLLLVTSSDLAAAAIGASRHVAIMGVAAVALHVGHAVGKRAGLDLDRHRVAAASSVLTLLLVLGGLAR